MRNGVHGIFSAFDRSVWVKVSLVIEVTISSPYGPNPIGGAGPFLLYLHFVEFLMSPMMPEAGLTCRSPHPAHLKNFPPRPQYSLCAATLFFRSREGQRVLNAMSLISGLSYLFPLMLRSATGDRRRQFDIRRTHTTQHQSGISADPPGPAASSPAPCHA
jgi:hypothetical protein